MRQKKQKKSIAYIHDRIFHHGGGGMVLEQLITKTKNKYSDHAIFTLFSSVQEFSRIPVYTALPYRLNQRFLWCSKKNIPFLSWLFDYRNMMPLYPILVWLLRKKVTRYSANHTVISSFASVKNIVDKRLFKKSSTVTLYMHSPMQYIRENYDEYTQKLHGFKKWVFINCSHYLRRRDTQKRPYEQCKILANSEYTKECCTRLYGRNTITVQYPALEKEFLDTDIAKSIHDYFIYVGRIVSFVRETDRIVKMCNRLSIPLLVVGSGPDEDKIKSLAGNTITFVGKITDTQEKISLIKKSRGMINLSKESCGIATMEALSLGVPVFGFNAGGTKELINNEALGIVVPSKDDDTLDRYFGEFIQRDFNKSIIKERFIKHYQSVGSII